MPRYTEHELMEMAGYLEWSEGKLKSYIEKIAAQWGWLFYHTYRSKRSPEGYPDVTLVKPPWYIVAELKSLTGEPSEDQWVWLYDLQEVAEANPYFEVYLLRPTDEDIELITRLISSR